MKLLELFRRDDRRQSAAPTAPIACPQCQAPEFIQMGVTRIGTWQPHLATSNYGKQLVCPRCGCAYVANPQGCYEAMKHRREQETERTQFEQPEPNGEATRLEGLRSLLGRGR